MNRLAGVYDESTVADVEGLRLTNANEDEDKAVEVGDGNEVITEGIDNVIDERRVITSHGSGTEMDEFGNLNERLVGLDNGCFCGEEGYLKDSGIETPMMSRRELSRGGSLTDCTGEMYGTAEFHGIMTFVEKRDRPEVPEEYDRRASVKEHVVEAIDGQDMARMGVG